MEILGCHHILYFTEIQFSPILNELKCSILQSAGCTAIILMLQPAVVAMFSIMQRARHKLLRYYLVTFSLSNLWKFLDAIMYSTSEL